jgi:hypothetical protein
MPIVLFQRRREIDRKGMFTESVAKLLDQVQKSGSRIGVRHLVDDRFYLRPRGGYSVGKVYCLTRFSFQISAPDPVSPEEAELVCLVGGESIKIVHVWKITQLS